MGATGPSSEQLVALGYFFPSESTLNIVHQNGNIASTTYVGAGQYLIDLVPIPGVIGESQLFSQVTVQSSFLFNKASTAFVVDHGQIAVTITRIDPDTNIYVFTDASFYLTVNFAL